MTREFLYDTIKTDGDFMIQINNKTECCGCFACVNICPKNCITMKLDEEGFRYPHIDTSACVGCGMCERVCPLLGGADGVRKERKGIKSVACYNKEKEALAKSASGGAAHLLGEYVVQSNGVVFGAVGDMKTKVWHIMAENEADLELLQGSKYLQSHMDLNYRLAKIQLEKGRLVLFTGTPCQIAGLYGYLGKDYDNLITADLVCHGVPSEKVFEKYITEHEEKTGKKVISFFRDKEGGWKPVLFSYIYEDGTKVTETGRKDKFNMGFTTNLFQRPSCYTCKFAPMERIGDITVGDWFGGTKYKELDPENKGLSMIVINSPKGEKFYELIKEKMETTEYSVEEAVKESVHLGTKPHINFMRKDFFAHFEKMTYDELFKRYFPSDKAGKLRNAILRRIYRMKYKKDITKMFR